MKKEVIDGKTVRVLEKFPSLEDCNEDTEVTLVSVEDSVGNIVSLNIESKEPDNEDADYRLPTYVLYTESDGETIERDDLVWNVISSLSDREIVDYVIDCFETTFQKLQEEPADKEPEI